MGLAQVEDSVVGGVDDEGAADAIGRRDDRPADVGEGRRDVS